MKKSLVRLNSRLNTIDKKISEVENILIGTMQTEAQRERQKINTARKISSDPTNM